MKTFNVIVYETNAITLQVEAEDDIEAARLVEADINKYPVISEEVIDWNVDFAEEIDNVTNEDDDEELTTQEQIDYINSHLTSEDNNCMQTFIPGFHD